MVVRRRRRRPAAHRAGQPGGLRPAPDRAADARRRRAARHLGRAVRPPAARAAAVRADRRARDGAPRGRARGRARRRATLGLPMVLSTQGSVPDGGDRRRARATPRAGSSSTGARTTTLVDSFVAPRRGDRQRGDRGHPRHPRARLAHPRPRPRPTCRSRAARASRSTPATRRSGALAEERAARPAAGPEEPTPRPTPGRGARAGLDGAALPRRRCATTCARRCRGPRSRPSSTSSPAPR